MLSIGQRYTWTTTRHFKNDSHLSARVGCMSPPAARKAALVSAVELRRLGAAWSSSWPFPSKTTFSGKNPKTELLTNEILNHLQSPSKVTMGMLIDLQSWKSLRTSSDSSSKASEKAKAPKEVMFRFTAAILWQNVRISGQILCLKQQILESGHCQKAFSPSNSKWWTFWSHFLIRQLTWHLKICFKFGEVQVKCKWRV